jgi:hypothetical protein
MGKVALILICSLIGIAGSYAVAWFGMRINTFANSRSAFASLGGKPYPTYAIPTKAGMSIGMLLISIELLLGFVKRTGVTGGQHLVLLVHQVAATLGLHDGLTTTAKGTGLSQSASISHARDVSLPTSLFHRWVQCSLQVRVHVLLGLLRAKVGANCGVLGVASSRSKVTSRCSGLPNPCGHSQ